MSLWNPISWPGSMFRAMAKEPIAREVARVLATVKPVQTTQPNPLYQMIASRAWKEITVQQDLISAQADCWEMYVNDGDIGAALDGIGIDACAADNEGIPFYIAPGRKARVPFRDTKDGRREASPEQQAIDAVYERMTAKVEQLSLYDLVQHPSSMALCLGRTFQEVVWDLKTGEALRIENVPAIREGMFMRKLHDPDTKQHVGWRLYDVGTMEGLRDFHPWQLLSYDWNNTIPLGTAVRLDWKMLKENEEDLYAARKSRAFAKLAKIIAGTVEDVIRVQEEDDKRQRENPAGVDSNLVANHDIKLLDPANEQLSKVDDLLYRRRKIWARFMKPIGLLAAYGADINRATLDKQDEGYQRFLSRVNAMVNAAVTPMLRIQLILWGYNPDDYPFQIKWAEKSSKDMVVVAQAMAILKEMGLSATSILAEFGWNWEDELEIREYEERREPAGDPFENRIIKELGRRNALKGLTGNNGKPAEVPEEVEA